MQTKLRREFTVEVKGIADGQVCLRPKLNGEAIGDCYWLKPNETMTIDASISFSMVDYNDKNLTLGVIEDA